MFVSTIPLMMDDTRAKNIQEKLAQLSRELDNYREEIAELKNELSQLTGTETPAYRPKRPAAKPVFFNLENFIGLKLIHFIGIIVLVIGLSIGVKYAIDSDLISPAMRILAAYLTGAALLLISLRLRKNYELFSMILFSGAMISAYFTTYAAFEYYQLLSRGLAFGLMLLITVFTVYTSIRYNRSEIAILGLVGAYGIPFFVGRNTGDIAILFSYILVINAGVLFISFRKYWAALTNLAFVTTWLIFFSCLLTRPEEEYFKTELLFGSIFYGLFLAIFLVFTFRKPRPLDIPDTILVVLDTALFYLSLVMLYGDAPPIYMECITLLFALVYMVAGMVSKKYLPLKLYFSNALFSTSLTAFVIFAALRFDGLAVTIAWVLMAVVYFITGMFYRIKSFRILSILL
ncbi:MAG: hypothetical protein JWQ78_328, partial [Sediminibacterium sp.]|nr:hypothetical protein [Sediminibacterium sp.]